MVTVPLTDSIGKAGAAISDPATQKGMRRSLVLTDDASRHPFLASLPPHIRMGVEPIRPRSKWYISRADIRGFFSAYVASVTAVMVFIA